MVLYIAIIIVALAGIAGYNVPNQELGALLRSLRPALVVCAALGGMFGLTLTLAALVWYACTAESFGVAWLYPLVDSEDSPLFRVFLKRNQRAYQMRDPAFVYWNRRRQK